MYEDYKNLLSALEGNIAKLKFYEERFKQMDEALKVIDTLPKGVHPTGELTVMLNKTSLEQDEAIIYCDNFMEDVTEKVEEITGAMLEALDIFTSRMFEAEMDYYDDTFEMGDDTPNNSEEE